tara:strand:+ start:2310 stop:2618 length:309 start_codon:yes stop_codon:yes gene_type:complete
MARFSSSANDIDEGRRVCLLLLLLVVLEDDLRTPTPTKFEFPGVVVREAARMFGGGGGVAGGGARHAQTFEWTLGFFKYFPIRVFFHRFKFCDSAFLLVTLF